MPAVPFSELMTDAEKKEYAVGYFESWNMDSLFAVADAAERTGSPVILGFSGIYLPHEQRMRTDSISHYASLVRSVCEGLKVPCCSLFNESPDFSWVMDGIDAGFDLVMFTSEEASYQEQKEYVKRVVEKAHGEGAAVEGETGPLPGAGGEAVHTEGFRSGENVDRALEFVLETGVDAFAADIGQAHVHGREVVSLDLQALAEMKRRIPVPLVLHGASSIGKEMIQKAVRGGIRKINVGSTLKRTYFEALSSGCRAVGEGYNPYEIIGSGFEQDVLMQGRVALQHTVEDFMLLFGSSGKAPA